MLLITGANGDIGQDIAIYLRERYQLRLLVWDPPRTGIRPLPPGVGHLMRVDIQDRSAIRSAMDGVETLIHLAGQREVRAGWHELYGPNIVGTWNVLQAAAEAGVGRVIFASSNHVTGGYDRHTSGLISPDMPVWPDSLYAVTKVFGEALARFVSDQNDMYMICLRIGWFLPKPHSQEALPLWLSPRDLHRLIDCCLAATVRYGVYYGVSANSRGSWDLRNARDELGYVPLDDSEVFAAELLRPALGLDEGERRPDSGE